MTAARPDTPPKGAPKQPDRPPPQKSGSRFPLWVWLVLFGLSLAWNAYALFVPKAPVSVDLPYSAFLDQVSSDAVASVTLSGQSIDGEFKTDTIWPPADQAGSTSSQTSNDRPRPYTRFSSVIPALGDDRLLPLLAEHHVEVNARDVSGGSWLVSLLVNTAPLLLFVGLLFLMGMQAQRSQQNLLGFGKSRARLFEEERPRTTFADVAGVGDAKAELQEIVGFLREPERYLHLGARLPRGALLIGPPGSGKTLLARAIAGEANVPFFSISGSQFVEMFVGVGASRVRDLFDKAKAAAPAIVFVDELDAVGRQRGAGYGGGNDEREQTLNQLLVEMDGFDDQTKVIVIAATNRPDVLDPALLRPGRFDRQVTVGLPDRAGRAAILEIHVQRLKLRPDVDLEQLAHRTPGFSGADLANLANEAALAAAARRARSVDMRDFEVALDSILLGTRQPPLSNEEERRVVAYHEAGHALVAKLTPHSDPPSHISIIPHGHALGATLQAADDDRRNYPRAYLLARLDVLLGGRAAEEVFLHEPTTGAESDLKSATYLARRMVGLWGLSDELGLVWYGVGETDPFLGRELAHPRQYSETTAGELDAAVRQLIQDAHDRATNVLRKHRGQLEALVEELLANESLNRDQLDAVFSRQTHDRAA
ncbi:MAG TPA: ATP-dependent zinc metalloprotease FtsH [Chloroflexota bacterium]